MDNECRAKEPKEPKSQRTKEPQPKSQRTKGPKSHRAKQTKRQRAKSQRAKVPDSQTATEKTGKVTKSQSTPYPQTPYNGHGSSWGNTPTEKYIYYIARFFTEFPKSNHGPKMWGNAQKNCLFTYSPNAFSRRFLGKYDF